MGSLTERIEGRDTNFVSLDEGLEALFASDPRILADPYPLYQRLREESPVHLLGPVAVLSSFADNKAAAKDTDAFSSRVFAGARAEAALKGMTEAQREDYHAVAEYDATIVSHTDGEQHGRLRRIAHRAFTPRRIAEMRATIEAYTDELIEPMLEQEVSDLKVLAYQLPLMVIADMLGVPAADRPKIRTWSEAIGRSRGNVDPDALAATRWALAEFGEYVAEILADLRSTPGETSLLEDLMGAEAGERMTTEELNAMFVFLLFAGHETTTNLIATGIFELLRRPEQWDTLRRDPAGVAPIAVEEVMRFASPVQLIQRIAARDVEVGGVQIVKGQHVIGLIGSANRDSEVFEAPDELDLSRAGGGKHIGFGFGPHFCLGAALARLEGEVAFARLASRFPDMRLAEDPETLRWGGNAMLRSLEALPVRLEPPTAPTNSNN